MAVLFTKPEGSRMYTHDGPALYLTADRNRVVEGHDPAAAFLLVAPGGRLPDTEATRYGLQQRQLAAEEHPEPAPAEQEAKQAPAKANKLKTGPAENK